MDSLKHKLGMRWEIIRYFGSRAKQYSFLYHMIMGLTIYIYVKDPLYMWVENELPHHTLKVKYKEANKRW